MATEGLSNVHGVGEGETFIVSNDRPHISEELHASSEGSDDPGFVIITLRSEK
jgi:hypothetical protein